MFLSSRLDHPQLPPTPLPRERLLHQFQQGLQFPCTLISAPAGFGKTTLLLQWRADATLPVAWLSLEAEDNQPFHFASYLVAALQRLDILHADFMLPMSAADTAFVHMFCTHLLSTINQNSFHKSVIVLDDYHIVTNPSIHQLVMFLIEHLPPSLAIVITTRVDPPLPLARWRTYGRLSEIRASDLRFLAPEITDFFHLRAGYQLTEAELTLLEQRCEGWVASLQMITLAQRDPSTNMFSFLSKFRGTHRYVLDYVCEEVLTHLLPDQLAFLLTTSVLDELCASLCNTLTAQTDGQQMLEHLEKANLFTIALDEERRWYRYHSLFADVLRRRLEDTQPELLPLLHQRASHWYEEQKNIAKAIHHAFAGAHLERVVTILEQYGEQLLFAQGEGTMLLTWLNQLPLPLLRSHARLCYLKAYAHLIQGRDDSDIWIHYAEIALPNITDDLEREYLQQQLPVLRFVCLTSVPTGDVHTIDDMACTLLRTMPQHMVQEQSMIQFGVGKVFDYHGMTQKAVVAYRQSVESGISGNNHLMAQYALIRLAQLDELAGRLSQAFQAYNQVIDLAQTYGEQYPATSVAILSHILLLLEWHKLDEAAERCHVYIQRYTTGPVTEELIQGLILQVQIKHTQGNFAQVNELLEHIKTLVETHQLPLGMAIFQALRVRLALQQDQYAEAERWLTTHPLEQLEQMGIVRNFLIGTWLRVHIALNTCEPVHAYLHLMLAQKQQKQLLFSEVEIALLQALAFVRTGNNAAACQHIAHSIRLAEPGGYIRLFTAEGASITGLLLQLSTQGSPQLSYIRKILHAARDNVHQATTIKNTSSHKQPPAQKHLLSRRELEILRLIATGASNQDISQQLTITMHTVKRHINTIFTKLAVTNRVQAVNYAREQGWL